MCETWRELTLKINFNVLHLLLLRVDLCNILRLSLQLTLRQYKFSYHQFNT